MLLAQTPVQGAGGGIPWQVIVPAIVAIMAAGLSYLAARRSDKSSTSTRTIELGVTELVNQLRAEREHLEKELGDCKEECKTKTDQLTERVAQLEKVLANTAQELAEKNDLIELMIEHRDHPEDGVQDA